jgi:hypothetical protein
MVLVVRRRTQGRSVLVLVRRRTEQGRRVPEGERQKGGAHVHDACVAKMSPWGASAVRKRACGDGVPVGGVCSRIAKASPRARSRRRRGARAAAGRDEAACFLRGDALCWPGSRLELGGSPSKGSSTWSSSSSGREHLRSSDNLDESGNFQLRREPLTAMANSGAVSPRPDIEGGRTASSAGRGNEECAARPTRPSESRGAISLNPGASRAARGQRWLNFGFYISGVARAPPHERSQ